MVIVTDSVLVASRRVRRLDASYQSFFSEGGENVVDCLSGDRADVFPHAFLDRIGCGMWLPRDSTQDGEPLRGHGEFVVTKELGRFCHQVILMVKWIESRSG